MALATRALHWCALDGGCCHRLQRACLLELAAVHAARQQPAQAAVALTGAASAAAKQRRLQGGAQVLGPVASASLPSWFVEQLREQEAAACQRQPQQQQRQPPALSEDLLGRLALARFCRLAEGARDGAPAAEAAAVARQAHLLAAPLRTACPKFAAECCWTQSPLTAHATPPPLAPGESTRTNVGAQRVGGDLAQLCTRVGPGLLRQRGGWQVVGRTTAGSERPTRNRPRTHARHTAVTTSTFTPVPQEPCWRSGSRRRPVGSCPAA